MTKKDIDKEFENFYNKNCKDICPNFEFINIIPYSLYIEFLKDKIIEMDKEIIKEI
jgi:hypothetical protein